MIATRTRRNPRMELAEQINALVRAGRRQFAAQWGARAVAGGLALDGLWLVAARLSPLPVESGWLVVLPTILLLAVLLAASLHRPPPLRIAQQADRALGLQERLTTAVEMGQRDADHALADLQLADTLAHLRRHKPAAAFPFRASRGELAVAAVAVASMVALMVVPSPERRTAGDVMQIQEVIKQEAERVATLAEEMAVPKAQEDRAARAAIAKALREAGQAMEKQPDSAEKAIAALAEAEQRLAGQQSLRAEDLRQALARAADALRREATTRAAGNSLAQGEATDAADGLRELGEKAGTMGEGQRAAAAQALRAAANNASSFDPRLGESLRKASEALAANDGGTPETLARAADDLQQASQEAGRQELLERALSELERSRATIGSAAQPPTGEQSGRSARERGNTGGGNEGAGQEASAQSGEGEGQQSARGEGGEAGGNGQQGDEAGGSGAGEGSLNRTDGQLDTDGLRTRDEQAATGGFERPSVSASERTMLPDEGEALVDYRDVYATYRDRATAATQDRYIPLDLKELVKDYFSALDPSR